MSNGPKRSKRRQVHTPLEDWRKFRHRRREAPHIKTFAQLARGYISHVKAVGKMKSIPDSESVIRRIWNPFFGDMDPRVITHEDIEAAITAQTASNYAGKSVRKHTGVLKSILEFGVRVGVFEQNAYLKVRKDVLPANRPRDPARGSLEVLSVEQVKRILRVREPSPRKMLWHVLFYTGARIGEASAIRWGDIARMEGGLDQLAIERTWNQRYRQFQSTKADRPRYVPVHPRLARCIERHRLWWHDYFARVPEKDDLLCPSDTTKPDAQKPRPWQETTALRRYRDTLMSAGVEDSAAGPRLLHGTRHTFITLLRKAGADPAVAMKITHHADFARQGSSYAVYDHHVDWETLCAAILMLEY